MSDFAYHCNKKSNGLVIKRLEQIYDVFILDEAQDIAGWDLDFITLLIKSRIKVIMVGDVRQKTYSTTKSLKNKKFSNNIYLWFKYLESNGYGQVKLLNQSYRCVQPICDFADRLFPDLPNTISLNKEIVIHQGIFAVDPSLLCKYCDQFSPQILVYDLRAACKASGRTTRNFGAVKGQTFSRVLIIPTAPILKYLRNGDITEVNKCTEKLYVAITRAKNSVAFLTSYTASILGIKSWT